ncbi:Cytochrome b-c1 complex subunit 9, mitochondrial [Oleoguttula sp. CCFEE 5521]|uniref:Complex III subunit 9 n=1 Tax=Cryoendolithus antarcticus TaxID=1507870 RepID=A0A1V8TJG5_9PEZI|nr:hypothetical protein B0A48_15135 [Cryoendolithus antarcticus]OQO11444.1 hypothetical protein B0A48_03171 [Cryoendolithus antarcticus]OQO21169.1 hypothetical protein B0A51_10912 [Rachicladosporium sp. CCFEE 5018]OQO32145.1 hypothetical protein B0A51_00988 [Rachicladosporium sp. CCFEE 5018]
MAGVLSGVYNTLIRSNGVFLSTIFAGAFATEILFDTGSNAIWNRINKGRQWKDIKHRYMDAGEDDE